MGGYLAYTEYKNSGIEWVGKVPSHWTCGIKLVYLSEEKRHSFVNGPFGSDLLTSELTDEGIPVIYSGDVKSGKFSRKSDKYVSPDKAKQLNFCRVDPGDLLLAKVGDPPGDAAIYPVDEPSGIVTQDVVRIKVDQEKASPSYLCHFMNSKVGNYIVRLISVEATRGRFSLGDFKSIKFSVPPLEEQRSIARFLNYKTAQIDALIAKKETLLKKLAEKRTALISQAVTKGCDRTVPMKDSGIEWLGEIPVHWNAVRIKHLGIIRYGLGEPPEKLDDGIPIIRATDIYRGSIDGSKVQRVNPDKVPWSRNPELKANDILVVRSGAYTGDSAIVPEEWAGAIAGYDMVVTPTAVEPEYLAYNLLSKHILEGQIYLAKTRAAQPHLNAEELGDVLVALPLLTEQRSISYFLDNETAKIDQQIAQIEEAIAKLKEYRTALITNAVIGKIDVRDVMLELEPVEAA